MNTSQNDKVAYAGLLGVFSFFYFFLIMIPAIMLEAWVFKELTPLFFPGFPMPERYQVMGGFLLVGLVFGGDYSSSKSEDKFNVALKLFGPLIRPLGIYLVGLFILNFMR